ncbi:hypothetical protein LCGC14_1891040 [marine sediment metagenome]|uniref:Uncharacterized protein n=1 Tax=marine sediment metagenome TaxID=412755 RepID=A0A0F9FZR3_9ZZZZ
MEIRELTLSEQENLANLEGDQERARDAERCANTLRREYIDELEKKYFSDLPPISRADFRQISFDEKRRYIISTVVSAY